MTKQNFSAASAATTCGNCTVEERWFLHHVRDRGIYRRLCTNCVLKLHSQSFCPTCFLIYNNPFPHTPPSSSTSNGLVSCFKCYSLSHNSCVGVNPPHPYICPLCVNPNAPVFNLKKGKEVGLDNEEGRVVDLKAAKVLLTAAKIAAGTVSKGALAARVEAERRAKEAAFTRKRAREALEHVAYLTARDKLRKKDVLPSLHSNGPAFVGSNVINRGGGNQCLSMVVAAVPLEEVGNADRLVDGSSEVLVALNAVDLKGKNPILGNGSAMDVEMNGVAMGTPSSAIRGELVQNHSGATRVEDEKSGDFVRENGQTEMVSNGMVAEKDQDPRMVNSNGGKANGSHPQL